MPNTTQSTNATVTSTNRPPYLTDPVAITEWMAATCEVDGYYEVSPDGLVAVNGSLAIKDKTIAYIMVQFTQVTGSFSCSRCTKLRTLEGAPTQVGWGYDAEWCYSLRNLKGAPYTLPGVFNCSGCINLETLEGAPRKTHGFHCHACPKLIDLTGAPEETVDFKCTECVSLTSYKGAPSLVKGDFLAGWNPLITTLDGAPRYVLGSVCLPACPLLHTLAGNPLGSRMLSITECPLIRTIDLTNPIGKLIFTELDEPSASVYTFLSFNMIELRSQHQKADWIDELNQVEGKGLLNIELERYNARYPDTPFLPLVRDYATFTGFADVAVKVLGTPPTELTEPKPRRHDIMHYSM